MHQGYLRSGLCCFYLGTDSLCRVSRTGEYLYLLKGNYRFVVMHVILFYHKNTLYAVVNGVIFQVRKNPIINSKDFLTEEEDRASYTQIMLENT